MVSLDSGQPAGAQAVRHLVYFCLADGRAGKWQKNGPHRDVASHYTLLVTRYTPRQIISMPAQRTGPRTSSKKNRPAKAVTM